MNISHQQPSVFRRALLILGVSFALALIFDYFFLKTNTEVEARPLGIDIFLYAFLVVAGLFLLARFMQGRVQSQTFWMLIPLAFFSVMVAIRESGLLTFFNIVACIAILVGMGTILMGWKIQQLLLRDYVRAVFLPFKCIKPFFQTLHDLVSVHHADNRRERSLAILRGVLLAIPVLVVFALLFGSADLIFQRYLTDAFQFNISISTAQHLVIGVIVTIIFTAIYSYIFTQRQQNTSQESISRRSHIGHIETSIFLGSINLLFFAFILIQIKYLFGGEAQLVSQGITYAEYARRGFFELIAVAVISFLVLWATEQSVRKGERGHSGLFKTLAGVLMIQVVLIMVSAFMRLWLYETAYGFTILRLYSHVFTVWLASIFVLLAARIFSQMREHAFVFGAAISLLIFLAAMNILNPDAFIAKQNIDRFSSTEHIDLYHLSTLSDDALPITIQLLDSPDENIQKEFAWRLYSRLHEQDQSRGWQSWNAARSKADDLLRQYEAIIEANKAYQVPF